MGVYTIRELENLSGIKAHTIRIWEKRYGLIAPQRTSTNIRTYCDSELKKLLNISILNRNGIKISKIAQLSDDEIIQKINQYTQEVTNTENQIENLILAMIDLDEFRFEQVLARSIIQFGFEDTVTGILYPFFVRIGVMWQTGTINPAQEHFVTNLVRQKFFVALDGLIYHERPGTKRFVFFLPEGELHELGLLFYCYLAKKRGHHVIYLGQSLPLDDLIEVVRIRDIDFVVTAFTSSFNGEDLVDYAWNLSEKLKDKVIFLSGSQTAGIKENLASNTRIVTSPARFIEELEKITTTDKVS
jgi:DNA-binding transcriptional MerR regulator